MTEDTYPSTRDLLDSINQQCKYLHAPQYKIIATSNPLAKDREFRLTVQRGDAQFLVLQPCTWPALRGQLIAFREGMRAVQNSPPI